MRVSVFRRNVGVVFVVLILSLLVLVHGARATDVGLKLPSTSVFIRTQKGTESFFATELSDVPPGYDVSNGTYLGWCVDVRANMTRSPATHEVRLFSSAEPPSELVNESWDMVNYILNHKQGSAGDVQQAIWYFVHMGSNYTPTRTNAWVIINDTIANGKGFSPVEGQTIAVICYPLIYSHQQAVQVTIIEITKSVMSEFQSFLILATLVFSTILASLAWTRKHRRRWKKENVTQSDL